MPYHMKGGRKSEEYISGSQDSALNTEHQRRSMKSNGLIMTVPVSLN